MLTASLALDLGLRCARLCTLLVDHIVKLLFLYLLELVFQIFQGLEIQLAVCINLERWDIKLVLLRWRLAVSQR